MEKIEKAEICKNWVQKLITDLQDTIKDDIARLENSTNKLAAIKCYLGDLSVLKYVMNIIEKPEFSNMNEAQYLASDWRWEIWYQVECNHRQLKRG